MKTTRMGSFETNSSSAHCFGVVSAEDFERWDSERWWLSLEDAGGDELFMEDDWSIEDDWEKHGAKYSGGKVDAFIVDIDSDAIADKLQRREGWFSYGQESLPLCFDIWPKSTTGSLMRLEGILEGPFTKELDDGRVFVVTFCY